MYNPVMDMDTLISSKAEETVSLSELEYGCVIQRISGWKKGKVKRIYCTTNMADFFYDLNNHVWNVSRNKTNRNLDTETLAKFVLGRLGIGLSEFQSKYAPPA